MSNKRFSSVTEQVAQILRDGLRQGRWRGSMPGRIRLAAELGVNHKTVKAANRNRVSSSGSSSTSWKPVASRPALTTFPTGDSPEELLRILDSLFRHTPPTALIIGDVVLFFAVQQHLARLGIVAPDHVSLACTDYNPCFEWCRPTIAHIDWEFRPLINRVVNWANNISRGKDDRRKSTTRARLVDGGTIGPATRRKQEMSRYPRRQFHVLPVGFVPGYFTRSVKPSLPFQTASIETP